MNKPYQCQKSRFNNILCFQNNDTVVHSPGIEKELKDDLTNGKSLEFVTDVAIEALSPIPFIQIDVTIFDKGEDYEKRIY